jgi:hypothetical protein
LHDRKQRLFVPVRRHPLELGRAAREPPQAPLAGVARHALLALARYDVIELHDHVGAQIALDAHHALRREHMLRAIEMTAEFDAVLAHGAQPLEREHLKPAGVGEDRAIPHHEAVQPAHVANEVIARPQVQMICVAEYHPGADGVQVVGVERLHRRERAHRHERRRLYHAVRCREAPGPRAPHRRVDGEGERRVGRR